jgi:hypothetical protein
MVEAGGVGTFSAIENTKLIDFSRRSKPRKLEREVFQPACHIFFPATTSVPPQLELERAFFR